MESNSIKILFPIFLLYRFMMAIRNFLYDKNILVKTSALPGKTISVGNIAFGGTGKSPMVIEIARTLKQHGYTPAILTRGYKSGLPKNESLVLKGKETLALPNCSYTLPDEARMQAALLKDIPVVVGANRTLAAQKYLDRFSTPTHWILDDGFQHRTIQRDLDLVLMDYNRPLNQKLFGFIYANREAISSLSRAHAIILTRALGEQLPNGLKYLEKKTFFSRYSTTKFCDCKTGESINSTVIPQEFLAITAIANSDQFFQSLENLGLQVSLTLTKPDHYKFTEDEIYTKMSNVKCLITTLKDYWRQPELFNALPMSVYALNIEVELPQNIKTQILKLSEN